MQLNMPYTGTIKSRNAVDWGRRKVDPQYRGDHTFDYFFQAGPLEMVATADMMFIDGVKVAHTYYHEVGKRGKSRWDRRDYQGHGIAIRMYSTVKALMNYLVVNEYVKAFIYVGMDESANNILLQIANEFHLNVVEDFYFVESFDSGPDETRYLMCHKDVSEESQSIILKHMEMM